MLTRAAVAVAVVQRSLCFVNNKCYELSQSEIAHCANCEKN